MCEQQGPGVMRRAAKHFIGRGEGCVFSIEEMEMVIFGETGKKRVEIDRRIRELRKFGWVIDNYRTDKTLHSSEHRITRIGDDPNDPNNHRKVERCPAKVRRVVFMRDGQRCTICGIGPGEEYPDWPDHYARLTIGRIVPGSKRGEIYTGKLPGRM